MTTKERLHQLIDAVPEEQSAGLLDDLPTSADLARVFILGTPEWLAASEEARQQKEVGVPFTPAKEVFATLQEKDRRP